MSFKIWATVTVSFGKGSWPSPGAISQFARTGEWPECRPVINEVREGAHTVVPQYACVNRVPSRAIRSRFGVWISFCP